MNNGTPLFSHLKILQSLQNLEGNKKMFLSLTSHWKQHLRQTVACRQFILGNDPKEQ